jgi:transposase InsO family protein
MESRPEQVERKVEGKYGPSGESNYNGTMAVVGRGEEKLGVEGDVTEAKLASQEAAVTLDELGQFIESMPELNAIVYAELRDRQREDEELLPIIDALEDKHIGDKEKMAKLPYHYIQDQVLMKSTPHGKVIVVPSKLKTKVLYLFHNHPLSAHAGMDRMVARLKPVYYWKGMDKDVKNWVKSCAKCAKMKTPKHSLHGKLQSFGHGGPFSIIQMDIVGPFTESAKGNCYWLTIIDRYSRWLEFIPLPGKSAEDVASALFKEWIARYGVPSTILSDNGLEFRNNLLNALSERLGVRRQFSAPYHPKTNGLCERVHRFAKEALGSILDSKLRQWDEFLPMLAFAHRTSPIVGLGFSPYELVMGKKAKLPGDFKIGEDQEVSQDKRKYFNSLSKIMAKMQKVMNVRQAMVDERASMGNSRRKEVDISPGESVLIRRFTPMQGVARKLTPKWSGPFKVVGKAHGSRNAYVVHVRDTDRVVNIEDIHVFDGAMQERERDSSDDDSLFVGAQQDPVEGTSQEEKGLGEQDIQAGSFVILKEVAGAKKVYLAKAINDGGGDSPVEYHMFNRMGEKARFYPVWLRTNKRGREVEYFMPKAGAKDEALLVSCGKDWIVVRKNVVLESGRISGAERDSMGDMYLSLPAGRKQG